MNYFPAPISLLLAQGGDAGTSSVSKLGYTPYVILVCYLLLLLVLGILGWIKSKAGEEDYYLAGRGQGWFVSSLTIMATFFSSFALLGAPGMVYREGVVFALFSLNVPVAALCVYLLGVRIWRLGKTFGYVTPGDMVADYYGSRFSLRALVALASFLYAIPYVVMQIQAGGLVSQELFGDKNFTLGATLLAAITMAYIMIGGMRSVAWTDLIQGIMLIAGMLVSGFAMLLVFNGLGNFSEKLMELPESSLTAPGNTNLWHWTMVLTVCVLGSSGSMVQPAQWMRYYAAKSARTLQRGAMVFAVVLTSCFILGVMLIGLAGQLLYPLHKGVTLKIKGGPAEITERIPAELQPHFRYIKPKKSDEDKVGHVIWSWPIKDKKKAVSDQQAEQLLALSKNAAFRKEIASLNNTLGNKKKIKLMPNPAVDADPVNSTDFDAILIVVLNQKLPDVLGSFGALFASLLIVSIMAASMSTADSNLHALSAVLTRDIYDQYIRPRAKERERVWVGRAIIAGATVLSLLLVIVGRNPSVSAKYDFLNMIAKMGLMAIAFSAQLLPIVIDILFLRKGTGKGAAAGLAAGLFGAFLFGPLFAMMIDAMVSGETAKSILGAIGAIKFTPMHGSVWGLVLNIPIFILVSQFTKRVPQERKDKFAAVMKGSDVAK